LSQRCRRTNPSSLLRPFTSSALVLVAAMACAPPQPLSATNGVRRLGESSEYRTHGRIAKRVLDSVDASVMTLEVSDLPESRVLFAVAPRRAEEDGDDHATTTCRIWLSATDLPRRELVAFELEAGHGGWVEVQAPLPAVEQGEVTLSCDDLDSSSVDWAQPMALTRDSGTSAPMIVLISIDTLRADYVAGFGGSEEETPNLARLGDEGLRVRAATSDGTWTPSSHAALLTSRFMDRFKFTDVEQSLARALSSAGYATVGITGGGFVSGFYRGFDHYWMAQGALNLSRLGPMVDDALGWIEDVDDAPTFLFFHTYAVHDASPHKRKWQKRHGMYGFRPKAAMLERERLWYAKLVARVDHELGRLFDGLREVAERRPVLLIVTSDHGEAFLEHDQYGHGPNETPYDELIRIPMIIWAPGIVESGRVTQQPTMLVDIAPSILAAVGAPAPPSMRGVNFWPLWSGARSSDDLELSDEFRGSVTRSSVSWSLREETYKLIVSRRRAQGRRARDTVVERRIELYDLKRDPEELEDLADQHTGEVSAMLARLHARLLHLGVTEDDLAIFSAESVTIPEPEPATVEAGRDPPVEAWLEDLDESTREQLRALGYIELP
jgi:arylsulfatase A-like enzyme